MTFVAAAITVAIAAIGIAAVCVIVQSNDNAQREADNLATARALAAALKELGERE